MLRIESESVEAGMKNRLMSFAKKCVTCICIMAMLAGCVTARTFFPLKADAAYPFDDAFYADMKLADRALVVVGVFGDEVVSEFFQTNFGAHTGYWPVPIVRRKFNEVYLIPVMVGKDFDISYVKIPPDPNKKSRKGEAEAYFGNPKTIRIDRPGIYYYGKIIFKDGKAYMLTETDSVVIDLAAKRHPKAFTGELPRINF